MKLHEFSEFLRAKSKERDKKIRSLIESDRNKTMELFMDYYDGFHWLDDGNGFSSVTRSGKAMFGKKGRRTFSDDPYGRNARKASTGVSFHSGQLQVRNFPKRFIKVYRDYINGDNNDEVVVKVNEEKTKNAEGAVDVTEINKNLSNLWKDIKIFNSKIVSKMILSTVAVAKLNYDAYIADYYVSLEKARTYTPIYSGYRPIGGIYFCWIEKAEVLAWGVEASDDYVTFAEIFYPKLENNNINYYLLYVIDGKLYEKNPEGKFTSSEEGMQLADPLNYNPYAFVANIDHPDRYFDDYSLEDSEMFEWINKVDSYNANATNEYVANTYFAIPRAKIDKKEMIDRGMDPNDPKFKQAVEEFDISPHMVSDLPFTVEQGQPITDSFFKGQEELKQQLEEDAGIPRFMYSGSIANLKAETIKVGLMLFQKTITDKRESIEKLVSEISKKCLILKGLVDENNKVEIMIDWPPIISIDEQEFIDGLLKIKEFLPEEYTIEQALQALGRSEDIDRVILARNIGAEGARSSIRSAIETQRRIQRQEAKARAQAETAEREREERARSARELERINNQLEELS